MGTCCRGCFYRWKLCRERTIPSSSFRRRAARTCPERQPNGSTSCANVRRCLGMDPQRLFALSGLSRGAGSAGRIQWQVHVQPIRLARRFLRYIGASHSQDLPQFLSTGQTLAVHRDSTRTRSTMIRQSGAAAVLDREPASSDFLSEVIAGLSRQPRTLPYKYFYDATGAALFQKICELPEYYITRTETAILRLHAREMAQCIGVRCELIGLGTGAGTKTRILLEELEAPAVYIPVDISREQLEGSTALFQKIFPGLEILPVCADYLEPLILPSPSH